MTALTGSADCASASLAATRAGWHRVAEHILAAALYRATGQIGLVPSPGGFRTPSFGTDAGFLAVDGTKLVVGGGASTRRTPLSTVRAAAEFAGITPGAPAGVCEPATPLDLDAPLLIEPGAARLLAQWYGLGAQALSRLAADIPGDQPTAPVLWPEHFDVGITAAAINYGASPGDDHIADPYLYVGPHDGPPPGDPAFWNAPFGAARTAGQAGTVAEAAAFFRDGRARVLAHAATTPTRRTS
jgi:hypothetical protein